MSYVYVSYSYAGKPAVSILNSNAASPPARRTHYTNLHSTTIHQTPNPHNDHTNTNIIGSSNVGSISSIHPVGHGNEFSNESEEYDYVGEDEDDNMTHSRTSPLSPSSFNCTYLLGYELTKYILSIT